MALFLGISSTRLDPNSFLKVTFLMLLNSPKQYSRQVRSFAMVCLFAVTAISLAICETHGADLRVAVSNEVQTANGGTFDVELINDSSTHDDAIAGFSLELIVDPTAGIQFTGATSGVNEYIFDGTGTQSIDPTFDFVSAASTSSDLIVGDSEWTYPDIAVGPGTTFGLAKVFFTVRPGTPGQTLPIVFGIATGLTDAETNVVDFTAPDGSIEVMSSVPEPSTALMLLVGATCILGRKIFRRSTQLAARCS